MFSIIKHTLTYNDLISKKKKTIDQKKYGNEKIKLWSDTQGQIKFESSSSPISSSQIFGRENPWTSVIFEPGARLV